MKWFVFLTCVIIIIIAKVAGALPDRMAVLRKKKKKSVLKTPNLLKTPNMASNEPASAC